MKLIFGNNAVSSLAGDITNVQTTINLAGGGGSLFPNPTVGVQYFVGTLGTPPATEIVWVTARTGDVLTVIRGQETTALAPWPAGTPFAELVTAGQMAQMLQQGDVQGQTQNYSADLGTVANSVVAALNPALTAPIVGMPIRVLIAHTNTGASTLNPGPGAGNIRRRDGSPCRGGELVAGVITEFQWTGANYDIMSGPAPASATAVNAQTDGGSFISPLMLQQAFTFVNGIPGYWIAPGPSGNRLIVQWGSVFVPTGGSASASFPVTMTGGALSVVVTPNFNVPPAGGPFGYFGGGPTGFTVVNQIGADGVFFWIAVGNF